MQGSMMQMPLLISSLLVHAERHHGEQQIVSRRVEGDIHRMNYRELAARARRMANALAGLGVATSDRVATLAWNGHRHLELYYAVSGSGAVLHTLNPRLHPDQVVYIADHAEDRVLFFDLTFLPLVEAIAPRVKTIKTFVAMTSRAHMPATTKIPNLLCYEELIAPASDVFAWPSFDENQASSLCYTSGTTGNPKGVLYSHRSTVLHTFAIALPDALNCSARDAILPVVPMFHVNAWGLPYAACMMGAKLVFPGAGPRRQVALRAVRERAGHPVGRRADGVAGAARVRRGERARVLDHAAHGDRRLGVPAGDDEDVPGALRRSGAARLGNDRDEPGRHGRGAEGLAGRPRPGRALRDPVQAGTRGVRRRHEDRRRRRRGAAVGRRAFGRADGARPVDRVAVLQGRRRRSARARQRGQGWFPTGDVATIDASGFMQITDRSKDVIKSGGEWIGSIDLENIAMAHPAVAMAACIAARHDKWDERPLLIVVKKPNASLTRDELLAFYEGRIAKWWTPDDVVFVDAIPLGATGKMLKNKLRDQYSGHLLEKS